MAPDWFCHCWKKEGTGNEVYVYPSRTKSGTYGCWADLCLIWSRPRLKTRLLLGLSQQHVSNYKRKIWSSVCSSVCMEASQPLSGFQLWGTYLYCRSGSYLTVKKCKESWTRRPVMHTYFHAKYGTTAQLISGKGQHGPSKAYSVIILGYKYTSTIYTIDRLDFLCVLKDCFNINKSH